MKEREPWRIDRDSVYFKVLKGWLRGRFRNWLTITAKQYKLSEDELLTRIIETIRRITWRTFQILKKEINYEEKKEKKILGLFRKKIEKLEIPLIIISNNPVGDLAVVLSVGQRKRNRNPDFLCDRLAVEKSLGLRMLVINLEELSQWTAEIIGGPVVCGSADKFGIAIYDRMVMSLYNCFNIYTRRNFLIVVIEEAFHCFALQTDEFQHKEILREKQKRVGNLDPINREIVGQEIEKKYGVKQKVSELIQTLEQEKEDLFSLLSLKITKPI